MPETSSLTGITYALRWESFTIGLNEINNTKNTLFVCPNPLTENGKLYFDHKYKELNVFIYNMAGQMVKKVIVSNSSEISLSKKDFTVGTYIISVIGDHKHIGNSKIVIE